VNGFYPVQPVLTESRTGVFFEEQTVESLKEAILAFEAVEERFSPRAIRNHALQFDEEHFKERFASFVDCKWKEFNSPARSAQPVLSD